MSRAEAILEAMGVARGAFAGQVALITGAARGIGEATARQLAGLGARVAIVDILDAGERVAAEICASGGDALFLRCDIAEVAQLESALDEATAALGPIDLLMNNAARVHIAPLAETAVEEWDRVLAVNLRAPFVAMRRLLPGMAVRRRG